MNFSRTFLLNAGGLFDFDLTFVAQIALFFILSLIVTFVFLLPVSKQINIRAESINYNLRESTIFLSFGYEKLSNAIQLLTSEFKELNRQLKLSRNYTLSSFENEVISIQKENFKLLNKLKGSFILKSSFLLLDIRKELVDLTDKFFRKKFNSI